MALTEAQNNQIAALQDAYAKATSDEERKQIHDEANKIRTSAGESESNGENDGNRSSNYSVNKTTSDYESTYNKYTKTNSNNDDANSIVSTNTKTKNTTSDPYTNGNTRQSTKTTIINSDGTEGTGYIIDGVTYTDPDGKNRISVGTSVKTANGDWYKLTDNGSVKVNNPSSSTDTTTAKTTYNATNWQQATTRDEREEARRTPSIVGYTKSGTAIYQTTVDTSDGIYTGYIINGECYYDKDGKEPVGAGAIYYTGNNQVSQKLDDGTVIDYTQIRQAISDYMNDNITEEELDEIALNTYGDSYLSLVGKNSGSTSTTYNPTSITPSSVNTTDMNATDATQYIISVYEESAAAAVQALKTAQDKSLAELDESAAEIKAISQTYKNSLAAQLDLDLLNLNEELAASGLGSGAAMQMRLSVNNAYLQKLSAFEQEEAQQLESLERDRANLKADYQNQIAQATIDNDLEKAKALLEEYYRQDDARIAAAASAIEYAYKYAVLEQEQEQFDEELAFNYEKAYLSANSDSSSNGGSNSGSGSTSYDKAMTNAMSAYYTYQYDKEARNANIASIWTSYFKSQGYSADKAAMLGEQMIDTTIDYVENSTYRNKMTNLLTGIQNLSDAAQGVLEGLSLRKTSDKQYEELVNAYNNGTIDLNELIAIGEYFGFQFEE